MDEIINALVAAGYEFYAVSLSTMAIGQPQQVDINVTGLKDDDSPGIVIGLSGESLDAIKGEIIQAINEGSSIIQ